MFDKGTIQLARIAGIPIRLHWSFLFVFVWVGYNAWVEQLPFRGFLFLQSYVVILFICVVMHEYGHALMARRFGNATRDILLTPIGGIARLESISEKPMHELLIAVAGPMVNFVIAFILAVILFFQGRLNWSVIDSAQNMYTYNILPLILISNLMLGLFNFIPAFPMDGGRILRALLSFKWSRLRATKIAATLGQVFALGFILFAFNQGQWMLSLIGVFIFATATSELKQVKWESILNSYKAADAMSLHHDKLDFQDPISIPMQAVRKGEEKNYVIYDQETPVGQLPYNRILYCIKNKVPDQPVFRVMKPELNLTSPEQSLRSVFNTMQLKSAPIALVMLDQTLVGTLEEEQLKRFVELRLNNEI